MREACLDRSIDAHLGETANVDYVRVDNTAGQFKTAGAALNYGAREGPA